MELFYISYEFPEKDRKIKIDIFKQPPSDKTFENVHIAFVKARNLSLGSFRRERALTAVKLVVVLMCNEEVPIRIIRSHSECDLNKTQRLYKQTATTELKNTEKSRSKAK